MSHSDFGSHFCIQQFSLRCKEKWSNCATDCRIRSLRLFWYIAADLAPLGGYMILLTFRLLMSYIYGAPILDVSRSHTTTQHSR